MSWRNTFSVLVGSILLSGLLLFSSASFAQVFEVTRLTHNSVDEHSPDMNDAGQIVWNQWDESDQEIFLYDGTSVTQLTDNSIDDQNPHINNRGDVVWRGDDGSDDEVFFYDGTGITQLTDNSYDDWPADINDLGDVVWFGAGEIFLYNGTGITQLTDNTYDDRNPKLNNSGQVVWKGSVGQYSDYLFFYDGNEIVEIPDSQDGSSPQINDQGTVVFSVLYTNMYPPYEHRYHYYLYDGTTTSQISPTIYYGGDGEAQINDSGLVVWEGSVLPINSPGSDSNIFLYDGVETTQLPRVGGNYSPRVNNLGEVAWGGFDLWGLDHEVFFYNGSGITQVTTSGSGLQLSVREINNAGYILWTAPLWDYTTEIFLAKPSSGGSCSGSPVASTVGTTQVHGPSALGKHMAFFMLPLGAVIALGIWRRKR